MEPDQNQQPEVTSDTTTNQWNTVTPLSRYLALALFVALPFAGGYVGYTFAPEKIVEVEKIVTTDPPQPEAVSAENPTTPTPDPKPGDQLARDPFVATPLATTTISMGAYRIRYSVDKIEVINDFSEPIQTIAWDTSFRKVYDHDESLFIKYADINYDHYPDLGVLTSIGYGGVNLFYTFYTYDPTTGLLEFQEYLVDRVSNPDFNFENRTITSSMKSGQTWLYTDFSFDGTKYIAGETREETWDN